MNWNKVLLICLMIIPMTTYSQSVDCSNGRFSEAFPFDSFSVSTISYGSNISALNQPIDLMVDIYEPLGDQSALRPLLILAFGGSFIAGERADLEPLCAELARKGFVCASIDYRIWPLFILGVPDSVDITKTAVGAISDMRAAIRFFRQSIDEGNPFRIHPDFISVGGISAGAITAIHAGVVDEEDPLQQSLRDEINANGGIEGNSGDSLNLTYSSEVFSIFNLSGAIFDTNYIDQNDPPIFSIQGTLDEVVPFVQGKAADLVSMMGSKLIHDRLDNLNIENRLLAVRGGMHTDIYFEPQYEDEQAEYLGWLYDFYQRNACGVISSQSILQEDPDLMLFPNPTSGPLIIQGATQDVNGVMLTDLVGRQIPMQWNQMSNGIQCRVAGFQGLGLLHIRQADRWIVRKVLFQ